ncbi:hypothetical protein C463_05260 [Halorubrum californiense DSM 19288]|uniref:Uncharacterized protein n=1 Tax=Halorubrum californiense DSM 19288 TaxID=1227465 RepID=M0EFF9_9EURY|nr:MULTISPECIES: hypothetical protein [Halorubrum]ELZ45818.1 hypothetical protein C463_05260 [Halorubrum californiense DSM 19288]TKX69060.1 hypothetical protein EXE40_11430 [Halorubrum sp. GN11GM_10-3_MGM]
MFARSVDRRPRRARVSGRKDTPAGPGDRPTSRDPFGDADERLDAREIDGEPFGDAWYVEITDEA